MRAYCRVPKWGEHDPAGEQEIVVGQFRLLNPFGDCVPGRLCDFKLYWLRCLLLHDNGASGYTIAMANVPDP